MNQPSDAEVEFLKSHRLAVLATGRGDGSPQQSLVGFNFDGADLIVSTPEGSAKAKNIAKRPRVSITVKDGPRVVVVYGAARLVRGAEAEAYRERLTLARPPGASNRPPPTLRPPPPGERIIVVITPKKYLAARLA